jgi:hypothetical protein
MKNKIIKTKAYILENLLAHLLPTITVHCSMLEMNTWVTYTGSISFHEERRNETATARKQ